MTRDKDDNDIKSAAPEADTKSAPPELPPGHGNSSINEPPGSSVGGAPVAPAAAPTIEGLDPDEAVIGGADLILHVFGAGFTDQSVIVFNGGDEVTAFVSATELTTGVKPSLVSDAIVVPVAVRNGAEVSAPFDFEFTDAPATRKGRR